jgi:signal transduction histidine kinase
MSAKAGDALFRAVFDLLPMAVWITDLDGLVLSANAAADRIWAGKRYLGPESYSSYEAWSTKTNAPVGLHEWGVERALHGEAPRPETIRIRCRDGALKTMVHWTFPLQTPQGDSVGAIVVNEDVTELQRIEEDLRDVVREREEVLSMVIHDLRSPLISMLLLTSTLDLRAARIPGSESLRAAIAGLSETARQMSGVVEDLLIATTQHRTSRRLNLTPTGPATLLKRAARVVRPFFNRQGLTLRVKAPMLLPTIEVDADRILRVFGNLLVNAAKFTPAPGQVVLRASAQDGGVMFSISNSGTPLPEQVMRNMFKPLWQARQGDSRDAGLGLSICRSIVQAHGGKISAEREEGHQVRVSFFLPAGTRTSLEPASCLQKETAGPVAPGNPRPSNSTCTVRP